MKPSGTLKIFRNQTHYILWGQSLSVLYTFQLEKQKNVCLTPAGATNLPSFEGARTDDMQVKKISCCLRRELVSFDPWHVTCSLPIRKYIWSGRFNNTHVNQDSYVHKLSVLACDWLDLLMHSPIYLLVWIQDGTHSLKMCFLAKRHLHCRLPYARYAVHSWMD